MAFTIFVAPDGPSFPCLKDQTVLQAALDNNFNISYGCRAGLCTSCRGKVLSGEYSGCFDALQLADNLDPQAVLFCQTKPLSDLTIEIQKHTVSAAGDIVSFPARIIETVDDTDQQRIIVKIPSSEHFDAKTGQRVVVSAGSIKMLFEIEKAIDTNQMMSLKPTGDKKLFASIIKSSLIQIQGPFN